ncbi:MAG: hypothetical protein ACOZBL_05265 [Patescibacteria group bacterium]
MSSTFTTSQSKLDSVSLFCHFINLININLNYHKGYIWHRVIRFSDLASLRTLTPASPTYRGVLTC